MLVLFVCLFEESVGLSVVPPVDKCTFVLMCIGLYLGECWFLKLFSKLGLYILKF